MSVEAEAVSRGEILRTGALAALVTLAGALVWYGPGIATAARVFATHDVSHSDIWHLNFPIKKLYAQALSEGRMPLWSPELGTGFPLLAQGQVGALYPFNLLLYAALPLVLAFNLSVLLHVVLAGCFAAMLARELGAGRAGALVAAVVFAFCGFFVVHVKHVSMTAAAVWAPLLLLLVERFARRARALHVALLALSGAAMLLAGHPQIAYYTLLVTMGWAAVLAATRRGRALVFAGGLAWAAVLALLLAAPQLLPTRELNGLGPRRGGLSLEEATEWRYEWRHLLGFVLPKALGDPAELHEVPGGRLEGFRQIGEGRSLYWEVTGYAGLLPLVLAGAALGLAWRRRAVATLAGLFAVSLLLALGPAGGLFHLLWRFVPGFAYFRFQSRFLLFADLALALLAGLGFTFVAARFGRSGRAIAVLAVAACFLDLKLALGDHNPTVPVARWLEPPPAARRIQRQEAGRGEPFRIATSDPDREVFKSAYRQARGFEGHPAAYDAARNVLAPNLSALYGLDNLEFFFPLYPQWMDDAVRLLAAPGPVANAPGRIHGGFASLFNVRYILDVFGLRAGTYDPSDYDLLETWPAGAGLEVRLLRNRGAFPRAFVVPGARFVSDRPVAPGAMPESVRAVVAADFAPRREVSIVLRPGTAAPAATPADGPLDAPVAIERYTADEVRLRVAVPRPAWLVLDDTYYPGWHATVNGTPAPIWRANVSMRAVHLAAGPAEVVFRYEPAPWRRGWLAALAGIALTATLSLQVRIARRRAA